MRQSVKLPDATIDTLVNLDILTIKKCVRYFKLNIGWFMEYHRLEHDWIVLYLPIPR